MFKRVFYDHWTSIIPVLSFCLTFAVFVTACVRALILSKKNIHAIERLPLQEESVVAQHRPREEA